MGRLAAVEIGNKAPRRPQVRASISAVLVWSTWAAATLIAIWYIRHYARNVPFFDDFTIVSVMTRHEPLTYQWASAQYNEHRNVIPRLLQVALLRAIPDFRAGLYLNAGFLSAAAASAIVVARRLRGSTSLLDVVLPLSILTLGQCECLLVGFALNLVMTSWITWRLIAVIGLSPYQGVWWTCLRIGGLTLLLPLCGGSGMAMLPPLALWLAGYVACEWWSGREPGPGSRATGIVFLTATCAVVAWYLNGYVRPAHIPPATSVSAVCRTTLEVCSLVLSPTGWGYWRAAGLAVVLMSAATMILLGIVTWRVPEQRARAIGLIAVLLSLLGIALAVGYSRSGLGPGSGGFGRYITIVMPLLGVVYFAWLIYGKTTGRRAVQVVLLTFICASIPEQARSARAVGEVRRDLYIRIESGLQRGMPASRLLDVSYPALFPDRDKTCESFHMLKQARVGKFRYMSEEARALGPGDDTRLRR
jgi:hypothetical protein